MGVNRRSFFKGILGGGLFGRLQQLANTHRISVEYYLGDQLDKIEDWNYPDEEVSYDAVQTVLENYTTTALKSLETTNSRVEIDITVHTDNRIPMSEVTDRSGSSGFQKWESYVKDPETEPSKTSDSVILLTNESHKKYQGYAELPCSSCSSHKHSVGIVYEFNPFECMKLQETSNLTSSDPLRHNMYGSVCTALHEVGHTIGLTHSHTEVTENNQFAIRSTLMMDDIRSKYDLAGKVYYRLVRYNATVDDINARAYKLPSLK